MYASNLDFAGLYTFPNSLSKVPAGSALVADNLVASKDGLAELRRGFGSAGSNLGFAGSTYIWYEYAYQNRMLIIDGNANLRYDSNGSFNWVIPTFPASTFFNPVLGGITYGIRGVEANKNFYFNTNTGIQKLSAYNANPVSAGVSPALDGTAVLAGAGSGFLGSNTQCAYQIVFGYTDANGNLILGSPSERILIVNSGGGSDNVTVTFTVPLGLTTSYFYQVYRTPQSTYSATPALNVPPGAEPQLSAQYNLTAGQVAALSVTFTDVTTDALLGAALYTNPSQQGALQPNTPPPYCADMCVFNQMMFYANCQTLQTLQFSLISVGAPNGIQINDTIVINGITFTGKAAQANGSQQFKVDTGGTTAQNIDNTARNLVQCINANVATTFVYAQYLSGYNSLPGFIGLSSTVYSVAGTLVSAFYVTSSRGGAFSPTLPASGTTFGSSNDVTPNGIYVSKAGQPEAVPAINLNFVGGGDQPIYRVLPLRDRVIVLKSDGVYVITGSTPQNLSITLLDSTIICIAPQSAVLLNNSVYCMTSQGVVSITESGVTIQSRAIEQDLLSIVTNTQPTGQTSNFRYACTGISYESERLYILTMPTLFSDTYGTQAYCYNWITNAWTRWTMDIACGLVNPFDNKLYLSRPLTNNQYIFQERKTYSTSDYYDDSVGVTVNSVDGTKTIITLSTTPLVGWVGQYFRRTAIDFLILSVNVGTNQITVQNTAGSPIATGAGFIETPISFNLTYTPLSSGFPHYVKDWTRFNFWLNGRDSWTRTGPTLNFGFYADNDGFNNNYVVPISTSTYLNGSFQNQAPQAIPTLVPPQCAKSHWIIPNISGTVIKWKFACAGVTGTYEIQSDVTG